MNNLITRLAATSGIPVRRLVSGNVTPSDWLELMAACRQVAAGLDAEGQDRLDVLLDRLEARQPLEEHP